MQRSRLVQRAGPSRDARVRLKQRRKAPTVFTGITKERMECCAESQEYSPRHEPAGGSLLLLLRFTLDVELLLLKRDASTLMRRNSWSISSRRMRSSRSSSS